MTLDVETASLPGRAYAPGVRLSPRLVSHLDRLRAVDWRRPVPVALAAAAVLHLLWWLLLANSGGDTAAQDAWEGFVSVHPDVALNLSWYGGIHVASYSVISPYLMSILGVRTTMMIAGTLSAGLLAYLLESYSPVQRPMWPALYGALAFTGNAVSGRVTFGLGMLFGLAAVVVVSTWPDTWSHGSRRLLRGGLTALLTALSAMASPVAGLFLGLVAAALWLRGRRAAGLAIGLPPVVVVGTSALLFPFSGEQPMSWNSVILPVVMGASALLLLPRSWQVMRIGGAVYVVAVLAAWLVPSPIGTNVTRLGLIFGGVILVASFTSGRHTRSVIARRLGVATATGLLGAALATSTVWQVTTAAKDAASMRPPASWQHTITPLVRQLQGRGAALGRVEIVPTRSHRESSAFSPYVNLARGWNRQADASHNALFYSDRLSSAAYERWLHHWAVGFVVLPSAPLDHASLTEGAVVGGGVPYLTKVWADRDWTLYQVKDARPLVSSPATVLHFDAAEITLSVPRASRVVVRVPDSPWLSLVDADGTAIPGPSTDDLTRSCLTDIDTDDPLVSTITRADDWLVLHAAHAGVYQISSPYKLPRGTACLPSQ